MVFFVPSLILLDKITKKTGSDTLCFRKDFLSEGLASWRERVRSCGCLEGEKGACKGEIVK